MKGDVVVGQRRGVGVAGQFMLLAVVWGASFLFIKIGLEGLSPAQVVLGRLLTGAVALVLVSLVGRQRPPRELVVWAHLAVVSVLLCVVPFLLFAWAEQRVPSGLASIYNATTPLMTALVALLALRTERPTRATLTGLLVGFAGVVVVLVRGAAWAAVTVWARLPACWRPRPTARRLCTCAGSSHPVRSPRSRSPPFRSDSARRSC